MWNDHINELVTKVNLLQQWRHGHDTSLQNLSFEITLNTWTFIVAM